MPRLAMLYSCCWKLQNQSRKPASAIISDSILKFKISCVSAGAPPVDWTIVELAVVDLCDARVVEAL